jgi:hypothetical protein
VGHHGRADRNAPPRSSHFGYSTGSVEFGPHLRPNTRFQAQPSDCTNFVVLVYKPLRFSADPRCSIPKLTEFGKFAGPGMIFQRKVPFDARGLDEPQHRINADRSESFNRAGFRSAGVRLARCVCYWRESRLSWDGRTKKAFIEL